MELHRGYNTYHISTIGLRWALLFIVLVISFNKYVAGNSIPDSTLKRLKLSANYSANVKEIKTHLAKDNDIKLHVQLIRNYNNLGYYDSSLTFAQNKLLVFQKNNDTLNSATLMHSIGNTYYYLNEFDKAKFYWQKCLNLTEFNTKYYTLIENCTHNLGALVLEKEYDIDKAEIFFLKALEYGRLVKEDNGTNLNIHYRLLASIYDHKKRFKQSDSLFNLIIKNYKTNNDASGLCEAYTFYARLFKTKKEFEKALIYVDSAITLAKLSSKQIDKETSLSMKVEILADKGDYKEAFKLYTDLFYLVKNKHNEELTSKISDAEAKYLVKEALQGKQLTEEKTQRSKQQMYFILALSLFVVASALILFYQKRLFRLREKNKLENLTQIHQAQEKERSRMAQDLHDNMGAYTTSILAQIDLLENSIRSNNGLKVRELRSDAENIMSTLRETIWILKTKSISLDKFMELIKNYCNKHLQKNIGIAVSYSEKIDNEIILSPSVTLHLYRIIQESIQNIIKHSGAKHVNISIASHPSLFIEIIDNGIGFNVEDIVHKSGLDNMAFRANEINFQYSVESSAGKGTRILLLQNTPL